MGTVLLKFLDSGARIIVTITLCSLLVALVCFGLLESTGATETPTGAFTGAFAAFFVTFGAMSWFYLRLGLHPGTTVSARARADADFVFEEIVKVVDFRQSQQRPQVVTITDYRVLTKESDAEKYVFTYGTNGSSLTGDCLSHPGKWRWRETTNDRLKAGEAHDTRHTYVMELDISDLARGQSTTVITDLTYVDAFLGEEQWLHTHVDEPTGSLTFVVLFPGDNRPMDIVAEHKGSSRSQAWVESKALSLHGGQVVYWRVNAPTDEKYRLGWHWSSVPVSVQAKQEESPAGS